MGVSQRIIRQMYLYKGGLPLCVREGGATDWERRYAFFPKRMFSVFDGFGKWVWFAPYEERSCKTADWLMPGPAYWLERRTARPAD